MCIGQYKDFLGTIPATGTDLFSNFDPFCDSVHVFLASHTGRKDQYTKIFELVKLLLVLSHGQATVEKGFSINNKIEVENMKEMIVAIPSKHFR